jgi:hypothetical protein
VTRVWYCANCGYEVNSRGRCHACREKLTPSALPELQSGPDDEEVGYRIEGWTDRDRGRLIVRLNDLGVEHRFEGDELVIDASDEDRVDDLVATLGVTAEENLREDEAAADSWAEEPAVDPDEVVETVDTADREPEFDEDDDSRAAVRLLADAATRLRNDPTDMQADADVAEASAVVFMADSYGPFDEEAWSAVGRVTRRLLSALGADEALEDEIRKEAGVLEKLLAPVTGTATDASDAGGTGASDPTERTVYDLADWLPDQRAQIGVLLEEAGIDYAWEGDELLVASDREDDAEALFDRIAGVGYEDEDGDERRYQAVAELFAACGRLAGDPTDEVRRENVLRWVKESEGPPLLGMDEVDWFRIRTRAKALAHSIESDHNADEVFDEANQLHDLLRSVV